MAQDASAGGRPQRAETRRRVLDAAYAVFSARGIAASSLVDVAREAGLTKGAIYSNFSGKDDLVLALMEERAMGRLVTAVDDFVAVDAGGDHQRALAEVGRALSEAMHSDAAWHRLLAEYYAMSHHDPGRRERLRLRRREARDAVARAVAELSEGAGLPLPLPPDEFAVVLFALSNGLAVEIGIDPGAAPDDLFGRVLALLTLHPRREEP